MVGPGRFPCGERTRCRNPFRHTTARICQTDRIGSPPCRSPDRAKGGRTKVVRRHYEAALRKSISARRKEACFRQADCPRSDELPGGGHGLVPLSFLSCAVSQTLEAQGRGASVLPRASRPGSLSHAGQRPGQPGGCRRGLPLKDSAKCACLVPGAGYRPGP